MLEFGTSIDSSFANNTKENKMVVAILILSLIVFLTIDFFLRKEEKRQEKLVVKRSGPLFLDPDKALVSIGKDDLKYYHPTHSWVLVEDEYAYVGFDNFISKVFSPNVSIKVNSAVGHNIEQGDQLWDIGQEGRTISQVSPISGKVISVNQGVKSESVSAKKASDSWVIKLKPRNLKRELKNLMKFQQSQFVNQKLFDDLLGYASGSYLNDGGELVDNFITKISEEDWEVIKEKYF